MSELKTKTTLEKLSVAVANFPTGRVIEIVNPVGRMIATCESESEARELVRRANLYGRLEPYLTHGLGCPAMKGYRTPLCKCGLNAILRDCEADTWSCLKCGAYVPEGDHCCDGCCDEEESNDND